MEFCFFFKYAFAGSWIFTFSVLGPGTYPQYKTGVHCIQIWHECKKPKKYGLWTKKNDEWQHLTEKRWSSQTACSHLRGAGGALLVLECLNFSLFEFHVTATRARKLLTVSFPTVAPYRERSDSISRDPGGSGCDLHLDTSRALFGVAFQSRALLRRLDGVPHLMDEDKAQRRHVGQERCSIFFWGGLCSCGTACGPSTVMVFLILGIFRKLF